MTEQTEKRIYLWSDKGSRPPEQPPSFSDRMDARHTWPNYSIHPYGRKKKPARG